MWVQRRRLVWTFIAALAALAALSGLEGAQPRPRIAGTFSSLSYNKEGGDLLGYELKIVPARNGKFQGALQIAEGVPSELMLVDIEANGKEISFTIPEKYEAYEGRFSGAIEGTVLRGEFKFKGGGTEKVEMKRGKGYWD